MSSGAPGTLRFPERNTALKRVFSKSAPRVRQASLIRGIETKKPVVHLQQNLFFMRPIIIFVDRSKAASSHLFRMRQQVLHGTSDLIGIKRINQQPTSRLPDDLAAHREIGHNDGYAGAHVFKEFYRLRRQIVWFGMQDNEAYRGFAQFTSDSGSVHRADVLGASPTRNAR